MTLNSQVSAAFALDDNPQSLADVVEQTLASYPEEVRKGSKLQESFGKLRRLIDAYTPAGDKEFAFLQSVEAYLKAKDPQGAEEFHRYVKGLLTEEQRKADLIKNLAQLLPAEKQRAIEKLYGALSPEEQKGTRAQFGAACPAQSPTTAQEDPLTTRVRTVLRNNADAKLELMGRSMQALNGYCTAGVLGLDVAGLTKVAKSYCSLAQEQTPP